MSLYDIGHTLEKVVAVVLEGQSGLYVNAMRGCWRLSCTSGQYAIGTLPYSHARSNRALHVRDIVCLFHTLSSVTVTMLAQSPDHSRNLDFPDEEIRHGSWLPNNMR